MKPSYYFTDAEKCDECCGTCNYHEYSNDVGGYTCDNERSDYYGDETDYEHSCADWEER